MTFQEYLTQEDPIRKPYVSITKEDCKSIIWAPRGGRLITLEISGDLHQYILEKGGTWLQTIGGDGNPMKLSCFHWGGLMPIELGN